MLLLARTLISPQKSCQCLQWGTQWLSSIRSTPDWLDVPTQMCLRRENTHTKNPCTFPRIWTYTVQCLISQMQPKKSSDPQEFYYLVTQAGFILLSLSLGKKDYLEGYSDSKAEKLRAIVPVCGREDTVSSSEQCSFMDCWLITA